MNSWVNTCWLLRNNAAVNLNIQVFAWTYIFISFGCIPRSVKLCHMVNISHFETDCFPKWLHHCTFPPIMTKIPVSSNLCQHLLLSRFLIWAILMCINNISLWFWFAFPWWLMMLLSTFSYAIGHLYMLFGEISIHHICPVFNWVICLFIFRCNSSLHIFIWLVIRYIIGNFSLFCRLSFHFFW